MAGDGGRRVDAETSPSRRGRSLPRYFAQAALYVATALIPALGVGVAGTRMTSSGDIMPPTPSPTPKTPEVGPSSDESDAPYRVVGSVVTFPGSYPPDKIEMIPPETGQAEHFTLEDADGNPQQTDVTGPPGTVPSVSIDQEGKATVRFVPRR